MVIVAPKSVAERLDHSRTNVVPVLDKNGGFGMQLECQNYIENWGFADVNDDGDPEGFRVGLEEQGDGYNYYLSAVGGAPSTLAAQNNSPLSMNRPSFMVSQPWVPGHAPTRDPLEDLAPPDAPFLQLIPSGQTGYAAGTYLLFWSLMDTGGRHTSLSPPVSVTVPTTGYSIRVPLPQGPFTGSIALGLWMTPVNGTADTARLQRLIDVRGSVPKDYLLSGPYRVGQRAPQRNETYLLKPPAPYYWFERDAHYGMPVCSLQFAVTYITDQGESLPSDWSPPVFVRSPLANTRIKVLPRTRPLGVKGWKLYVLRSFNVDTGPYEVLTYRNVARGSADRYIPMPPLPRNARETLIDPYRSTPEWSFGIVYGTDSQNAQSASGKVQPLSEHVLETKDLPSEDKSGMAGPSAPLPDLTVEATQVLAPGQYWCALSKTLHGEEGPVSAPARITVQQGYTLRILPAHPVNYFANAEGIEVDPLGRPLDHPTAAGSGTGSVTIADGVVTIRTNGNITGTATSPLHQLVSRPIQRELAYELGEDHGLFWTAGNDVVYVDQLDASGGRLTHHAVKTFSQTGFARVRVNLRQAQGTEGAGVLIPGPTPTVTFDPACYQVRLSHEEEGSTRNMTVRVSEMYLREKNGGRPRKRLLSPPGSGDPANSNPPPETPIPRVSAKGTEPAPSPPAYSSPAVRTLERVDFESGVLPPSWLATRFPNDPTTVSSVDQSYAIEGGYGWRISRSGSSATFINLQKTYGSAGSRNTLALRVKVRVNAIQPPTAVTLLGIKNLNGGARHIGDLGFINIDFNGSVGLYGVNTARVDANGYFTSPGSYRAVNIGNALAGDVLDLELIATRDPATGRGSLSAYVGKNGVARTFAGSVSGLLWPSSASAYPQRAVVGAYYEWNTGATWSFDIDSIAVTETGDSLSVNTFGQQPLEPIPKPDRPTRPGNVLDFIDFETGAIPASLTQVVNPTPGGTLTVQTASAIDGSYGLRATDTSTVTPANAYVQKSISGGSRDTAGLSARFRVVTLPTAGEYQILAWLSGTTVIASGALTSTGDLLVRYYNSSGQIGQTRRVAANLASGSVFTLEMILFGTGTSSGAASVWYTQDGFERQLLDLPSNLDWTALPVDTLRAGLFGKTVASGNASVDIDSLLATDRGSLVYQETAADGTTINQVHVWYSKGIPVKEKGRYLETLEPIAVEPGRTYSAGVDSRVNVHPDSGPALPYYFVAWDKFGNRRPLGSLYGDAGVVGEQPWQDLRRDFTIPQDCYLVTMESRNIGAGEFVCQSLTWSGVPLAVGQSVPRERVFPASGSVRAVLDTETPGARSRIGRKWLRIASQVDTPAGTSVVATYASSPSKTDVTVRSPFVSDTTQVPQARYLFANFQLASDTTGTPYLRGGSPLVEHVLMATNAFPLATLLRADGSELTGGVILDKYAFPRNLSDWDVRPDITGRVSRFRANDPVGQVPRGFSIWAGTREAMAELEETCMSSDFILEARGERMRIRFVKQFIFEERTHTAFRDATGLQPIWRMYGEAKIERVETYEVAQIQGVYPS